MDIKKLCKLLATISPTPDGKTSKIFNNNLVIAVTESCEDGFYRVRYLNEYLGIEFYCMLEGFTPNDDYSPILYQFTPREAIRPLDMETIDKRFEIMHSWVFDNKTPFDRRKVYTCGLLGALKFLNKISRSRVDMLTDSSGRVKITSDFLTIYCTM